MTILKPRKIPTQVKHKLLEEYLTQWGSIITMGLKYYASKMGREFHVNFNYIDCFAYAGRYAKERQTDDTAYGSPIIGIRAMDNLVTHAKKFGGFVPMNRVVLIEKNKDNYRELLTSLEMAGYKDRIRETDNFGGLRNGEIAVVCGEFSKYARRLRIWTSARNTYSLFFLDPYGVEPIPLEHIAPIVSQEKVDAII